MRIILAITDSKRRNIAFVNDLFKVLSLSRAIKLAKQGSIAGVHIAKRGNKKYLRTNPDSDLINIGEISVHWYLLSKTPTATKYLLALKALKIFWAEYKTQMDRRYGGGEQVIVVEDLRFASMEYVRKKLIPHRTNIFSSAKKYQIDPYLLGAILIDEIVRFAPFEDVKETFLAGLNLNVSVGVAQVTLETARDIIAKGYYNPNPTDPKLAKPSIYKIRRGLLYEYLNNAKHNVFFGAARVRMIIYAWEAFIDLRTRPEIIATLYSQGIGNPKTNPVPNDRGLQIANEFYKLAGDMLGNM